MNYDPVIKTIRTDLDRWTVLPLDMSNRIETIKMNVLPWLLYLCQSLPVEVPPKDFREWNRMISRFVWNSKRPQIKYKSLQLPKEEGGLSLPCVEDYNIAAQLRPLVCWCNPNYSTKWKDLELTQSETPAQSLLGNCQHHDPHLDKTNCWTRVALKVWFNKCKKLHLEKHAKILKWVAYDSEFIPLGLDKRFRQWAYNGITAYCTIADKDGLQSFTHISKSYRLGGEDRFRYFQVRDYFNKETKQTNNRDTNLISIFTDAYKAKDSKHLISQIYKRLQNSKNQSTLQVKQKWEGESGLEISEDDWRTVWAGQAKTTNSRAWREFCWKNRIRFFVTPKLKSKQQGSQGQDKCWKQCGQTKADHFHIFWSCPLIQPYWQELAGELGQSLV